MKQKPFHTSNVLLLSFSHFIHDIYTSFLAPLLPLIIENLSLSLGQAGLLSAVHQLPSLFNPVIGVFADRKGLVRWLVILAPTMT
ncbi:MAG TPA: MFS transporter, partial [Desulfobacteraceae bacterium]|nr:MFS transporter [Desulfobacteraceae bacterium]